MGQQEARHLETDKREGHEHEPDDQLAASPSRRPVLLLDEPFEGLAPAVSETIFRALDRLRREVPILIVEHDLDLVRRWPIGSACWTAAASPTRARRPPCAPTASCAAKCSGCNRSPGRAPASVYAGRSPRSRLTGGSRSGTQPACLPAGGCGPSI